jgi:hypothetical protein
MLIYDNMEIKISRHARRRMALYHVNESDVVDTISREISGGISEGQRRTVVNRDLASKYGFPLKIIFVQKERNVIVVSAYPVKKERRQ